MAKTQKKKTGYLMHPSLTEKLTRQYRRMGHKKASAREACHQLLVDMPDLIESLNYFILAEEWWWRRQGRQVIFPENTEILTALKRARFEMGEDSPVGSFTLPYSSFVLAMPSGFRPAEGIELGPILVTWHDYYAMGTEIYRPYAEHLALSNLPNIDPMEHAPGARGLSIVVALNSGKMEYIRTLVLDSSIPSILQARTPEEYSQQVGSYRKAGQLNFVELNEYDRAVQFYAFRLIAALAVYHQATKGVHLNEGFPEGRAPRIVRGDNLKHIRSATLRSRHQEHDTPHPHIRTWHFRQLRHERYYRGEHAHKPRGSRWVFVSEATVGKE